MWVAALINPYGTPARLVEAVASGHVVAVATQQLLDELTVVLMRSKFRQWVSLADAVALVEALAGTAELRADPKSATQRVRDQHDDYLVALAEAACASIVTGDRDLLEAGLNPPAITPRALVDAFGG